MIRICYIISDFGRGGAQKQLYELVKGLDRHRFKPIVISLSSGGYWSGKFRKLDTQVVELERKRNREFARLFKLVKLLKSIKPDIVHTYLFDANAYGRIAAILARITIIIASERNLPEMGKTKNFYKLGIDKFLALFSKKIICNSNKSSEYLVKRYSFSRIKVTTVHNGIDAEAFAADPFSGRAARPGHKVIGNIGRLCPQKNHKLFLDAAKIVSQEFDGEAVRFLIGGDGTLKNELELYSKALGIEHRVSFAGDRTDISGLLQNIDIFMLTSNYEGMSNVIMEAMAAGLPVVATDVGGNNELVIDGVTGFLCPLDDAEIMAEAVVTLLKNEVLAKQMGDRGRMRILHEFGMAKMLKETENIYTEFLRAPKNGATDGHKQTNLQADLKKRENFTHHSNSKSDHALTVFLMGPLPPPIGAGGASGVFRYIVDDLKKDKRCRVIVGDTSRSGRGGTVISNAIVGISVLVRLITNIRAVDVATFHSSERGFLLFGPLFFLACRISAKPCVFRFFGGAFDQYYQSRGKLVRWLIRKTVLRANLCLFQTKNLVDYFKGMCKNVVWFSNYTRDIPRIPAKLKPKICRRFVYLGHITNSKGIDVLLKAAPYLSNDVTIHLYGTLFDGYSAKQIADQGCGRVLYRGVLTKEEVFRLLWGYDAVIHPTVHPSEGYPGAIIEGLSHGLPIITTRWRSIPEIVDDTCGLFVEPLDVNGLASAVNLLQEDMGLFNKLRMGSFRRAQNFSDVKWTEFFIELLQQCADGKCDPLQGRSDKVPDYKSVCKKSFYEIQPVQSRLQPASISLSVPKSRKMSC